MRKKTLPRFIHFAYQTHKEYFFVMFFSSLVTTAQTLLGAYTISLLIHQLEMGRVEETILLLIMIVIIEMILMFLNKWMNRLLKIHQNEMHEGVCRRISEKIMSLPFAYLESNYYMELKKNAEMGVNNMGAVYQFCEGFFKIASSLLSLLGLGFIIFSFDPILIVILAVGICLNILLVLMSMKTQIKFFHDLLPINFKYGYYMDTIISEKNAKDFRLYSSFDLIYKKFSDFSKNISEYFTKLNMKMAIYQSFISTVRYIQMALVYILVGIRTILNHLSISEFTLTVSAALSFSDCITSMIEVSSSLMRSIEYVKPILELMDIEEDENKGKEQLDEIQSIVFDHVSFAYPNTDTLILDDISFTMHKNEKISIVGLNGAGKTTIVKLICRLYAPTQGKIYINDHLITDYEAQSYLSKISTVFQDYKMFAMSIKYNVSFDVSLENVKKLCYDTHVASVIEALPNQWNSILSKAYDEKGIELSGGQTQKIAIARALAKPADLLILDEPTSALDPLAEAEVYENFNGLAKNKMAIYISHRMSSSIFCDKILVLEKGHISDFDTHQNLMKKKDSLYYKLFMTQAKNYALK